jgi:hypothetical protein
MLAATAQTATHARALTTDAVQEVIAQDFPQLLQLVDGNIFTSCGLGTALLHGSGGFASLASKMFVATADILFVDTLVRSVHARWPKPRPGHTYTRTHAQLQYATHRPTTSSLTHSVHPPQAAGLSAARSAGCKTHRYHGSDAFKEELVRLALT